MTQLKLGDLVTDLNSRQCIIVGPASPPNVAWLDENAIVPYRDYVSKRTTVEWYTVILMAGGRTVIPDDTATFVRVADADDIAAAKANCNETDDAVLDLIRLEEE